MSYGKNVPGLEIDGVRVEYEVLDERGIRAGAGLMFAVGIVTMMYTFLTKDFVVLFVVLPIFWFEFAVRTLWTPRWAPLARIGDLLVVNQKKEWVGAVQKRFAWGMGLGLATLMMVLVFWFAVRGPILLGICALCLVFMWLESAVGLCVGCKIYYFLRAKGRVRDPGYRPACAGGVCRVGPKN